MIAITANHAFRKYASPIITEISHIQRSTISRLIGDNASGLSQETHPDALSRISSQTVGEYLSEANRRQIERFSASDGVPYLLLKKLIDIDHLPLTPSDDASPDEAGWRKQAATMLGYLRLCGVQAASFQDEMGGRLFHMVMPAKNSSKSLSRSTKALNFHTEVVNGYFEEENPCRGAPIAPNVFSLACLRNPDKVRTTILPLSEIINELSGKTILQLMKPEYCARSQSSFDRDIEIKNVQVLVPLYNGHLGIRYSYSKLAGMTDGGKRALAELREIINMFDESYSVVLEPGDVLVLNNRLCLHGRGEVGSTSNFDGLDRWLLRLYGYSDSTFALTQLRPGSSHVMQVKSTFDAVQHLSPIIN